MSRSVGSYGICHYTKTFTLLSQDTFDSKASSTLCVESLPIRVGISVWDSLVPLRANGNDWRGMVYL